MASREMKFRGAIGAGYLATSLASKYTIRLLDLAGLFGFDENSAVGMVLDYGLTFGTGVLSSLVGYVVGRMIMYGGSKDNEKGTVSWNMGNFFKHPKWYLLPASVALALHGAMNIEAIGGLFAGIPTIGPMLGLIVPDMGGFIAMMAVL